jgi:hypothetical protein
MYILQNVYVYYKLDFCYQYVMILKRLSTFLVVLVPNR